jgi:hypothetical protein
MKTSVSAERFSRKSILGGGWSCSSSLSGSIEPCSC